MQLAPGDRIGQYEILRPLGVGGMGEVYRARDEKLGREIALKILPAELAGNPDALRRFEQEARAASALNHPNIVTIYEINQSDGRAWIAMELVDGEDLRTMLSREPLSLKNALRIATKVADGLAAAHERGIVHRDLKPDNVMVTHDGFVKILDFGLAKQIRTLSSDDTTMPHTSPGTIFGTVGYMSPEQANGREMDACSDQFSFGVMLYEMLTRQRVFEKESRTETLASILRDDPPPPSAVNEAVSCDLDRIVSRCLAKNPRERYDSTRDLARDLREVRDSFTQSSTKGRAYRLPFSARERAPLRWLIAVLVLIVGTGVLLMWKRRAAMLEQTTALAVVPFRDLSGSAEGRVLADGISEMVATRLAEVRELRVATPFDGAPIADGDDVPTIARRTGAHAVVRGTVQRGGDDVRVTYTLVDARSGATLAASTTTRPIGDLFALQDSVAEDLLRALGRSAPDRQQTRAAVLGAEDQRRFIEAIGLLQRVRDEQSVDRAVMSLESILRNARDSGPVNALLARALLYKSQLEGRPALVEQAMVYASRAVALSTNDPECHVTLGHLQNASGRPADAIASFERGLSLRPDDPDAMVGLATAYDGQGRAQDAETMYRRALALRPDSTGALMRFGTFCYVRGRYREAEETFLRAAQLSPRFALAHSNHGAALQGLGRNDEALAAYQKAIALTPTAPAWTNLGALQFSLGRYADAMTSFERATRLAPANFIMWANLGDACRWAPGQRERAGDAYRRAIETVRAALQVNPNDAYARSVLALCLAKSGRTAEAQTEIRRALEIDPTNASVLYKTAVIAVIQGNHDSAVSWVERAVAGGYPAKELLRDPELAPIQSLPSFRNAVKSSV